jgi:hypothetical protein
MKGPETWVLVADAATAQLGWESAKDSAGLEGPALDQRLAGLLWG